MVLLLMSLPGSSDAIVFRELRRIAATLGIMLVASIGGVAAASTQQDKT
jgi:hypothetical protein